MGVESGLHKLSGVDRLKDASYSRENRANVLKYL